MIAAAVLAGTGAAIAAVNSGAPADTLIINTEGSASAGSEVSEENDPSYSYDKSTQTLSILSDDFMYNHYIRFKSDVKKVII